MRAAGHQTLPKQQRFEDVVRGKAKPFPKLTKAHNEEETLRLRLRSYCDSVVEDHEDALAELIVAEASPENALQSICRDATASCDEEGLAAAHISEAAPEAKKRRKKEEEGGCASSVTSPSMRLSPSLPSSPALLEDA